ncbi:MAG: glycine cleavage system protein GcvH [Rhodothermales bacterium]|nr:glycine cleavage system protein GcvH [Rhodothermales bacterium]
MDFPKELRYTKEHEWVRLDGQTAQVGITDFAQGELGDIVFVELESVGSYIEKDAVFGTVEAVKTVSELYMPLSGRIVAINEYVQQNPELVNESPYEKGWMIRIEVQDAAALSGLMSADDYAALVG